MSPSRCDVAACNTPVICTEYLDGTEECGHCALKPLYQGGLGRPDVEIANVGFSTEELDNGITKVVLDGSLDIAGAAAIDLKMNIIAGAKNSVLIDLQQVTFIGSMGLRALVSPARAILSRKGKIAVYAPTELVEKVLKTSGIDTMIPIFHDYDMAMAALQ